MEVRVREGEDVRVRRKWRRNEERDNSVLNLHSFPPPPPTFPGAYVRMLMGVNFHVHE